MTLSRCVQTVAASHGLAMVSKTSFFKLLRKLEADGKIAPGLTFHGLRHTRGGELAECGLDDSEIALCLGQKSAASAQHYSRRAKVRRRMKSVVKKIQSGEN